MISSLFGCSNLKVESKKSRLRVGYEKELYYFPLANTIISKPMDDNVHSIEFILISSENEGKCSRLAHPYKHPDDWELAGFESETS